MPLKTSTPILNDDLRARVFAALGIDNLPEFKRIGNCGYGIILTDLDGNERYVQVNVKATKVSELKSARAAMEEDIEKYTDFLEKQAQAAAEHEEKVKKGKAKREKEKAKKESEEGS